VTPLRYTYKTKPRRYQEQALMKIHMLEGRAGVFMPMRTGKSKVAIDWAGIGYYNFDVRRVLVVCHAGGLDIWPQQIAAHCGAPWSIVLLDGSTNQNAQEIVELMQGKPTDQVEFIVVNYEMVWRTVVKKAHKNDDITIDKMLARCGLDLIIADEAHRLKWPTTNTSNALARLGQHTRMALALTGTPVTKWPLDVFGLFRYVNSNIFGIGRSAWKDFRARFGVWGHAAYAAHAEVLLRLQNQEELVSKIHANSFRIRLEDAIPELPERIVQNVTVHMSAEAQRMYREMAADMITDIEGHKSTASIILTKSLRLSTITSGWVKDTDGTIHTFDDAKLRACMELIDDMLDQDEKVIVFAHFQHDYRRVFEALGRRKIKAVLHAGTDKQKAAAKASFQTDPTVKVFVSQTATGSLGLDLSAARMIIFYSWDHRWDTYTQAVERPFMPGKTDPIGVYHLVVPKSIDGVKLRSIKKKGDMADAVLFNPQRLINGEDDPTFDEDLAA
jgi:SNF2 family DNA or RNA helicase